MAERPQHMLMRVSIGIHKGDLDKAIETCVRTRVPCARPCLRAARARVTRPHRDVRAAGVRVPQVCGRRELSQRA